MRELLELVFHEAAASGPEGNEALRRYDDDGKGRIRWAEARGHGMGWRAGGERIGWSLRPYSHFVV